jgi:predicted transcriptional regulator
MRWRAGPVILMAALLAGEAAAVADASRATFAYTGSSSLTGRFDGSCTALGLLLPPGAADLSLSSGGGTLWLRRTILNRTTVLVPPDQVVVHDAAEPPKEERIEVPAGPLRLAVAADGLALGLPFGYARDAEFGFQVSWNATRLNLSAPAANTPTPAGTIWTAPAGQARIHPVVFPGWTRLSAHDGRAAADGNLTIYLRSADVFYPGGHRPLGPYRSEVENVSTPAGSHRTLELTDAWLDLRGAHFDLPPATRAACAGLEGEVAGSLAAEAASGEAPSGGGRTGFEGRAVVLEGVFRVHESLAKVPLDPGSQGRVEAQAEGDVRLASLDFAPTSPGDATPLVVSVSLGAVVLLALVWAAKNLGSIVGLFYSRLRRDHALDNRNRDAVHEAVLQNPGLDLSELAALTGLHRTTVFYHVQVLHRVGLVSTLRHGRSLRIVGVGRQNGPERARLLAARDPRFGFLVETLGAGPRPLREVVPLVADHFGTSRRAAYHTVHGAIEMGIVKRVGDGKEVLLACAAT